MREILEIFLALVLLILFIPIFLIIFIFLLSETLSPIFKQERVGKDKELFVLFKFRTMVLSTESKGTHEINPNHITRFGSFLRRTKLDELPQLLNVIKREMSFIGPRPNLPNQIELISERDQYKVYSVRPGITGLAQVQKIDMSMPQLLAQTDAEMIKTMSLKNYFKYVFLTVIGKGAGDRVKKYIDF